MQFEFRRLCFRPMLASMQGHRLSGPVGKQQKERPGPFVPFKSRKLKPILLSTQRQELDLSTTPFASYYSPTTLLLYLMVPFLILHILFFKTTLSLTEINLTTHQTLSTFNSTNLFFFNYSTFWIVE